MNIWYFLERTNVQRVASPHHRVSICPRVIAVLVAEAVAEWPVVTGVMGLAHATLRHYCTNRERCTQVGAH